MLPLDRPKARCEHMISDRAYAQTQSGKVIQDRGSGGHHERIIAPDEQALLHELNHSINNEFASAIGAVSFAAARSSSDLVKVALTGVAELLHHYAAVHHALQMPAAEALIDAAAYLRKLCRSISRSKLAHLKIDFVLAAEPLKLQSHKCWRLGMIVHELITNAARHAFVGRKGENFAWSYRARARWLNVVCWTTVRLWETFGRGAGSRSSTN